MRAAPLVRVKGKITVKNAVSEEFSVTADGVLTVNLTLTLKIGVALPQLAAHENFNLIGPYRTFSAV